MIVICTHKSPEILETFLKSIRRYSSEKHKILVVETSDSCVSQEVAQKYEALFENTTLKYEIGAYKHAVQFFPDESEYFMFQDSLEILQAGWEHHYRLLSNGKKMIAMASYLLSIDPCPGCGSKEFHEITGENMPPDASAVFCNCFYITQEGKNLLVDAGFFKIYANEKNDTYATERVLGALAHISCGFDSVSSILGEWQGNFFDYFLPNHGFTIFIYKRCLKRR